MRARSSGRLKGLRDVVVGAELQAEHLVGLLAAGGEDQHRHVGVDLAQAAQHLEAVHAGQHDVEQDQVGLAARRASR